MKPFFLLLSCALLTVGCVAVPPDDDSEVPSMAMEKVEEKPMTKEDIIARIRSDFERINNTPASAFTTKDITVISDGEEGVARLYLLNDVVKKIVIDTTDNTYGRMVFEFYVDDALKPFFVFSRRYKNDQILEEHRIYFYDGNIIRYLDNSMQEVSLSDPEISFMKAIIMYQFRKIMGAANLGIDSTI